MKTYLLLALFILAIRTQTNYNQRPVIGILTQTDQDDIPTLQNLSDQTIQTYITASYVKFVEMSGAQVVPIFAFGKLSDIAALLPKLNGVLFPGGQQQNWDIKDNWVANTNFILQYAIEQNDKGNVFPVWGTCLGLQLLTYLTANYDYNSLTQVHGQLRILNTLNFTGPNKGYAYGDMPSNVIQKLTKGQGIVYFNHHWALLKSTYQKNLKLKTFWNVIAETTSPFNQTFVSVMEAKKYPFYAVQFHPQKALFEWKVFSQKSFDAVTMVHIISNKFIQKARQSRSQFNSYEQFKKVAIYNYKVYPTVYSFTRVYLFNQTRVDSISYKPKLLKHKLNLFQ